VTRIPKGTSWKWLLPTVMALTLLGLPLRNALAAGADNLASATPLSALPYTDPGQDTTTATREAGEFGSCGSFPIAGNLHSVWYQYAPAATGWLAVDTLGSNYDTALEIYTGAAPNFASLTSVACNDDVGALTQSALDISVTVGSTYYIVARDFGAGSGGALVFHASFSTQQQLYVNEATGKDTNPGSVTLPVKTIKRAVEIASPGAVVNIVTTGAYGDAVVINKNLTLTSTLSIATSGAFTLTNGALLSNTGNVTGPSIYVNQIGAVGARIQDGVLLAAPGGTVTVGNGTYTETVTVNKSLTLQGNAATTIIRPPSPAADAVIISSGGAVTVTSLSLQTANAGVRVTAGSGHRVSNSNLSGNSAGITNTTGSAVIATSNWWNSNTGPTQASNPGGVGQAVSDNVTFSPWCTRPAPTCTPLAGIATELIFTTQPGNGSVGVPLPTQPVLRAQDVSGNLGINFNSAVTLTFGSNPGGATIGGANPVSAVNGVVTYTNISLTQPGLGYTLIASGGALTSAPSNAFNIGNNPPVAVNDAPSVLEDSVNNNLNVLANDSAGDPFPDGVIIITASSPANGTIVTSTSAITYTPNINFFGTDIFTYRIGDVYGSGFSTATVTVTVTAVNDPPSFTKGADQNINEEAGAQTVSGWASAISVGPANEAGQTLTFTLTTTNPSLFVVAPAVNPGSGNLTYAPAPNANGSATVFISLQDNGGTANGGVNTSITQTFLINVAAVNDVPTFVGGSNQSVAEDSSAQTVTNWATAVRPGPASAADESGQALTFNIVSNSNPGLFSAGPTVTANSPPYPTTANLNYTPALNANGTATLVINLQDNGGTANGGVDTSTTFTFTITLTPVNDPPTAVDDTATVNEGSGATALNALTNDYSANVDGLGEPLTITTLGLASNGTVIIIGGGTDVTYQPNADFFGSDSFTYTVSDGAFSDTALVNVTVNAINDQPSFTPGPNQNVLEDVGAQSVPGWASALSPGPANESGQTLTFIVTSTDPSLFSAQPALAVAGSNGDLTYTPASNVFGSATVFVTLQDNGGTANGGDDSFGPLTFTITVTGVNDEPTFTNGGDRTALEDSVPQNFAGWGAPVSPGPNESGQSLTFTITNTNNSLFSAQPDIDELTGNLTFTPAPNANGSATMFATLFDDGGTANGGDDTSATQTFSITITAVNDEPSFTMSATLTVSEDAGPQTFGGWTSSISPGPSDEAGQVVSFTVTHNQPLSFTVQPFINAAGALFFTTAPDVFGAVTATVVLTDNGGIANSGDDTSAPQTFTINIAAQDDTPLAAPDNVTVLEDGGPQPAYVLSNDSSPDDSPLSIAGVTQGAFGSVAFTPTLATYAPTNNYFGADNFTYTLSDGGLATATGAVTVTVLAVNDVPAFIKGPDQTLPEDSGAQTIPNWASGMSPGPANESGQTLTFTLSVGNPSLFSAQPIVDPTTGQLTYTPAPDAFGSTTVLVTLQDSGGTVNGGSDTSPAQSLVITLTAVNDPPTANDDSYAVLPDSANNFLSVLGNDTFLPDGIEPLTVTVVGDSPNGATAIVSGVGVNYTPDPGFLGSDSFTYTISDGVFTDTALVTVDVTTTVTVYRVLLPLVVRSGVAQPDLVVGMSLNPANPTSSSEPVTITITITNQGTASAGAFWIDLYINPLIAPTGPNVQWQTTCALSPCYGMAWYVPGPLAVGQSLTLTSTPGGYCEGGPVPTNTVGFCSPNSIWPGHFAAGTTDVYVFVDSFSNPAVSTGAVLESNETNNRAERQGLIIGGALEALGDKRDPKDLPERGQP